MASPTPSLTNPTPKREGANQARHLTVNEPTERAADAIYIHDEDDNDIATFFHSEHATVGQSYETALRLATLLVEANNSGAAEPAVRWSESTNDEPLWCMHVVGSDDVHAAPDFWTALAWAAELNTFIAQKAAEGGWAADDNYPLTQASADLWPGSAESHAVSLAKELAERADHEKRRAASADPVRAVEEIDWDRLNELFSQIPSGPWDAFRTGGGHEIRQFDSDPTSKHHWPFRLCQSIAGQRAQCDDAVFDFLAGVLNAWPQIVTALSVSTPTGEGEDEGLRRACVPDVPASDHLDYLGEVIAQYVTNVGVLADAGGAVDAVRAALAHPQQGGERNGTREALEIILHVTDIPKHKLDDAEFLRGVVFCAKDYARAASQALLGAAPNSPSKSSGEEA